MLSALPIEASAVSLFPTGHGQHGGGGGGGVTNPVPVPGSYSPGQISTAYGFNPAQGNGSGQTIAIVDAYGDSRITSDLSAFDSQWGLSAPPSFKVVNQSGGTKLPGNSSGWDLETSLDVEWAHAIAPGANILLVEASNSGLGNLLTAVNYARNQTGVVAVSMSWGGSEFSSEAAYDSYFTTPSGHPGVAFVAASGDSGGGSLIWPSASPNVLSVGGTTLTTTSDGSYVGETGWSGSGGGYSLYESQPVYQDTITTVSDPGGKRMNPDVAYNANPNTGFAVYDSVSYNGQTGWLEVGGTSAGAPQWSALIAIADEGRHAAGKAPLANVPSDMYGISSTSYHDITSGSNGAYTAGTGYDLVTGLGTPVANAAITALVNSTDTAPAVATTTSSSTTVHHGTPPSTAAVSAFVVDAIVMPAPVPAAALPPVLVQPPAATTSAPSLSLVTNVLPAAAMRPMTVDTRADLDFVLPITSPSDGDHDEATTLLGGDGRAALPGTAVAAMWGDNGSATVAATGQRASSQHAVTSGWAACDTCYSDEAWSAVSWEWVEPLMLGLGETGESMPHPVLLLVAALAALQGYTRFRSEAKDSPAVAA